MPKYTIITRKCPQCGYTEPHASWLLRNDSDRCTGKMSSGCGYPIAKYKRHETKVGKVKVAA